MKFFDSKTLWFILACAAIGAAYGFFRELGRHSDPATVRQRAISEGKIACVEKARQAAKGSAVNEIQIDAYCRCAVGKSLDALDNKQLLAVTGNHVHLRDALGTRYEGILQACRAEAFGTH